MQFSCFEVFCWKPHIIQKRLTALFLVYTKIWQTDRTFLSVDLQKTKYI